MSLFSTCIAACSNAGVVIAGVASGVVPTLPAGTSGVATRAGASGGVASGSAIRVTGVGAARAAALASIARVQPRSSERRRSGWASGSDGDRDQVGVRPGQRQRAVVDLDQAAHERARVGVARPGPGAVGGAVEIGQVAPEHRGEAEQVAAPVELAVGARSPSRPASSACSRRGDW